MDSEMVELIESNQMQRRDTSSQECQKMRESERCGPGNRSSCSRSLYLTAIWAYYGYAAYLRSSQRRGCTPMQELDHKFSVCSRLRLVTFSFSCVIQGLA